MRITLLLISSLSFLFSFVNTSNFKELYSFKDTDKFNIITTKDEYKVILKGENYIDYRLYPGFRFFIPIFTKEFSFQAIRADSIGFFNGIVFMTPKYKEIISTDYNNLKFYTTDYKTKNLRGLDYLLKGYAIPYPKTTYISIEAFNIPLKKSLKLNKYIYFQKIPLKNNKLKYMLYSFYVVFNKKAVDYYIKKHYPNSTDYIKTFLKVIQNKKLPKRTLSKKVKKTSNPKLYFHIRRLLYMKDFSYTPARLNEKKIIKSLNSIRSLLAAKLNSTILINPSDLLTQLSPKIDEIAKNLNRCLFNPENIKKECFTDKDYFQNYTAYLLRKNTLPPQEEIDRYGSYKTFNDIGKYYFEHSYLDKAFEYLQKAYIINKNPITAHNLGVLYATPSQYYIPRKAIHYFLEAKFPEDYYNTGVFYYIGKGVRKNRTLAVEYFKKAKNIKFAEDNLKVLNIK